MIIIDEMDAMCRTVRGGGAVVVVQQPLVLTACTPAQRSGASGDSSAAQHVYDGVVDQLLAKMDGLAGIDNVLVVGLTNRRDVIDEALLRPGRFEVQIAIGFPDVRGRRDIFSIHMDKMAAAGVVGASVDYGALAEGTRGMSGAHIAGIVRDAGARALARSYDPKSFAAGEPARKLEVRACAARGPLVCFPRTHSLLLACALGKYKCKHNTKKYARDTKARGRS